MEPDFIILRFKTLEIEENLINKSNLPDSVLHKGVLKITETKKNFNRNILPYTFDDKKFGNLIEGNLRIQYLTELVTALTKNLFSKDSLGFLKLVIEDKDQLFRVFLDKSRRYLIISNLGRNNNYNRYVYNIKTNQFLFLSKDILNLADESIISLFLEEISWVRSINATSLIS